MTGRRIRSISFIRIKRVVLNIIPEMPRIGIDENWLKERIAFKFTSGA
jgi:hypothetical protein